MIIRKYLVEDMNEAMFRIKYELGDEAYIISQKFVRRPGIKGFFASKQLEVTVGLTSKGEQNKKVEVENDSNKVVLNNLKEAKYEEFSTEVVKDINDISQTNQSYEVSENKNRQGYAKNVYASNNFSIEENSHKKEIQEDEQSRSMSYYNKLFEEKQKMLDGFANNNYGSFIKEDDFNKKNIEQEKIVVREERIEFKPNHTFENISNEYAPNYENLRRENVNSITINEPVNLPDNKELDETNILRKELQEVKNIVKELISTKVSVNILEDILYKQDICKELSDEIRKNCTLSEEELLNEKLVKKYLRGIFSKIIKVSNDEIKGRVVLIGPTGVGKTTTIAKLAGIFSINLHKKVGLLTIDTYRIGAIEQLKIYSEIMSLPYRVVNNLTDMKTAFDDMKNYDVLLIDTIGRSSKNFIQLSELKMFVETSQADNITLVISAGIKQQDMELFLKAFKQMNFKNVIITKLDETESFGMLVNICYKTGIPISFVSVGQDVPVDIKRITEKEILDMILGEEDL